MFCFANEPLEEPTGVGGHQVQEGLRIEWRFHSTLALPLTRELCLPDQSRDEDLHIGPDVLADLDPEHLDGDHLLIEELNPAP